MITKDGRPRGILLPTTDETLLEDVGSQVRMRAQRAVSQIRREAAMKGLNRITMEEIDAEIADTRRQRRSRRAA